ncbi:helix-turn-helix domain-containing protein [Rhodobium gokarnense]|uniref:XRE-type DNA-binding protein n=1 Tax=Rhodobium gokarnense TaxID=364296 RepID=A0ABT3HD87_9HYPH|nr:helix-turn-helix transcriptional regulator [Rhodobium gokarnense]MCW2308345.1 putative XRE-type DNA-binding protein [Rhodobium gokarnense]
MTAENVKTGSRNVFADMRYADAGAHQIKARIVSELEDIVASRKLTQSAAGKVLGISQPEVSRMFNGHFREYSIERLMGFLTLFNRDVEIVVRRHPSDDELGTVTFKTMPEATA